MPFFRVKGYIRREALFVRLQKALERKLTIISAAAGYGKTSLLSDFFSSLKERNIRAAWLTLDEEDASPVQFLAYLFATLEKAGVTLPDYNRVSERSFQDIPVRSVIASVFKSLEALSGPVVLIVDDYHRAAGKELDSLFEWLVRFSPPDFHIIVASREHPQIMREDLRVQGELLEFTSLDLAFTPDDVRRAFELGGSQEIDMKEIIRLTDRTEGWPLAVELALKWSLGEQHKAKEVSDFSGRTTDLTRYLSEQLLSRLAPETQVFLLQTSILPRISGDLANAVTGRQDSWALLEKLEQQNVFLLPMDGDNRWFRYHPLVAEFLTDRLLRTEGQDILKLHGRAAKWFGDEGYLSEALSHASLAADGEYIAALLERAGGWRLILDGRIALISHYLPPPGSPHLESRPRLQLARAFLLIKCGEIDAARSYFDKIHLAFQTQDLAMDVRLEEQMVGDMISEYEDAPVKQGDIASNERLISALPADDSILLALANETLASQYYYFGMLDKSLEAVSRATEYYRKTGSLYGEVFTIFHKSRVRLAQGKLKEAEKLLDDLTEPVNANFGEASDLAANLAAFRAALLYEKNEITAAHDLLTWALPHMEASDSWFEVCYAGYLTAACSAFRNHGVGAAFEILARARLTAERRHLKRLGLAADLCEIELAIDAGDLARAEALAASIQLFDHVGRLGGESLLSRQLDFRIGTTAARLNSALGQPSGHLPALEELAQKQGFIRQLMEIRILLALDYFKNGEPEKAVNHLEKAISAALFEGNIRIFVREGIKLLPLLSYASGGQSPLPTDRFRDNFIKTIQRLINIDSRLLEEAAAGYLLPQGEMETLRILGLGLTNKEIAIRLNVSPSTIKYRLKSLFAKLEVSSRKEAVKLARDKGWLDRETTA
jgi:LuxR family maltose regulon positive regulatory protein